jgi:hypothetical protein
LVRPPRPQHHHHHDVATGDQPQRHLYEGLTMRDTAKEKPALNRMLLALFGVEAAILKGQGRSLPFGHSIVVVGEAPQ